MRENKKGDDDLELAIKAAQAYDRDHTANTNTSTANFSVGSHNSNGSGSVCDEALLRRHSTVRRSSSATVAMINGTGIGTHAPHASHAQNLETIQQDGHRNKRYSVRTTSVTRGILARQNSSSSSNSNSNNGSTNKNKERLQAKCKSYCSKSNLQRALYSKIPLLSVVKTYSFQKLKSDLVAGITVAILAIPLGMSYARLAGLPAHFGLYASFVPPLVYPIFGTTPQLAVGTAALISLLVSEAVGGIVTKDNPELVPEDEEYIRIYTGLAIQCAFLAGIFNIGLGVLKLGFVTQFLSRAVISGFVSGAAIIIAFSQVQHILGYSIASSNKLYAIIQNLIANISEFEWQPFVLGMSCIAFLLGAKKVSENETIKAKYKHIKWLRATSPIVVSVVSIVLAYTLDLDQKNVLIIGHIPPGLPLITISDWTPIRSELLVTVVSMVIVGFVQSVSISKQIAYRRGYEIDPSQELVALGMASLIGGIFQSYPTSGAMGQSVVNDEIGAETGISSIITGLVVMCVLLFMTPVFEYMPLAVLAAIVISFVLSMVDYTEALYLYKVHKFDFAVWVSAFIGTMFLGVEYGLGIAVGISLLIVIYESAYPHTAVLGRLPGTTLYRNIVQYPDAELYDGLVIVRVDAPIYFANAVHVRDRIRKYKKRAVEDLLERDSPMTVQYIVVDLAPVSHMDTTGLHMLEDMYVIQKKLGAQLCLCNPGVEVTDRLFNCGFADKLGREHILSSVLDAVQWCLHDMDAKNKKTADIMQAYTDDEASSPAVESRQEPNAAEHHEEDMNV